jgi:hypothetical protein
VVELAEVRRLDDDARRRAEIHARGLPGEVHLAVVCERMHVLGSVRQTYRYVDKYGALVGQKPQSVWTCAPA